jgi:hypothetical protein
MSTGVWYHLAIVKTGSDIMMFQDGVQIGTTQAAGSGYTGCTYPLAVGADNGAGGFSTFWSGYIDELRISKGIARWTSDFTPPTEPYALAAGPAGIYKIMGVTKTASKKIIGVGMGSVKKLIGVA